ncbi:MAG TPA: manganese efflux pump MntP family protein [Myxococcota bacterium]|nr:manganese efflux pump MntP family protein [Myxococcota bacterium]HQK51244.1 manganese efflux pump MntP family protein [Myxococcota bacterium]
MSLVEVLGLAVALAMDAFAVAIGAALSLGTVSRRQAFRLSFHFGLFQFLMPLAGFFAGNTIVQWARAVDHWVAFALLAVVGTRMIQEGWSRPDPDRAPRDPTRGRSLLVLSVATSIDALAVGLSLGLIGVSIWYPAAVIGVVAAAFTLLGLRLGALIGPAFGHRMAIVGGGILWAIGIRILVEHLGQA